MENVNLRFRQFIEKTNFSPTRFSKEIGVNHESVNRLFRNRELMPSTLLLFNAKLRFPSLNVNHIVTGEDRLFLETIDTENIINGLEEQIKILKKTIEEKDVTIGHLAASFRNISDRLNEV